MSDPAHPLTSTYSSPCIHDRAFALAFHHSVSPIRCASLIRPVSPIVYRSSSNALCASFSYALCRCVSYSPDCSLHSVDSCYTTIPTISHPGRRFVRIIPGPGTLEQDTFP